MVSLTQNHTEALMHIMSDRISQEAAEAKVNKTMLSEEFAESAKNGGHQLTKGELMQEFGFCVREELPQDYQPNAEMKIQLAL